MHPYQHDSDNMTLLASMHTCVSRNTLRGTELFYTKLAKESPVDLRHFVHGFEHVDSDPDTCPDPVYFVDAPLRAVKYALLNRSIVHELYAAPSCEESEGDVEADARFAPLTSYHIHGEDSQGMHQAMLAFYRALFERNYVRITDHNTHILMRMMRVDTKLHHWWVHEADSPPFRLQALALRYLLSIDVDVTSKALHAILMNSMVCTLFPDVVATINNVVAAGLQNDMSITTFQFVVNDVAVYKTYAFIVESIQDLGELMGLQDASGQWLYLNEYPREASNMFVYLYVLMHLMKSEKLEVDESDFYNLFAYTSRPHEEREILAAQLYDALLLLRDVVLNEDVLHETFDCETDMPFPVENRIQL